MLNQSLNTTSISWKSRPNEWENDERMNALFTPFRNRDLNPLHYDGKLNFWKKAILSFVDENELLKINQKSLEEFFIRKGTKPKCLNVVLETLQKERTCISRSEFIKQQQQGWVSYAFDKLVWSPLSWTTKYIINSAISPTVTPSANQSLNNSIYENDSKSESSKIDYIFLDIVEKKSHEIHNYLINKVTYPELDCLIDFNYFQTICSEQFKITNKDDIELIVSYLVGKKRIVVNDTLVKDKKLIKFSQTLSNKADVKITDLETSYYVLKLSEDKFEKQINLLNVEIENMNKEIKLLLKQKMHQQALKLLKKRKGVEKQLDLKHQQVDNINTLRLNMQQADTNKMAMQVFAKTSETLKNINKEFDLDKVDDLMLDIEENLKINHEIETTLSKPVAGAQDIDDSELENELNELVKQKLPSNLTDIDIDLNNLSIDDVLNNLPNVPNESFGSIKSPLKNLP